jgi:hypothetical protein
MEPASESQTLQLPSAERVTATKVTRGIDTELVSTSDWLEGTAETTRTWTIARRSYHA